MGASVWRGGAGAQRGGRCGRAGARRGGERRAASHARYTRPLPFSHILLSFSLIPLYVSIFRSDPAMMEGRDDGLDPVEGRDGGLDPVEGGVGELDPVVGLVDPVSRFMDPASGLADPWRCI